MSNLEFVKNKINKFVNPKKILFNFSFFNKILEELSPLKKYCIRCNNREGECNCSNPNLVETPISEIFGLPFEVSSKVSKEEKIVLK